MITVYKYTLLFVSEIAIPKGAKILSVGTQGSNLYIWAEIDTDNDIEVRNFHTFGTGHEIPQNMGIEYVYVGTGFMKNGLVWHVYERIGL